MRENFFEERGLSFRSNQFRGDRPTLVFVHGLSGSCSAWYPYERIFEDKYNILTFDLRGHGKSRKFFFYNTYAPELMGDDIIALLTYTGIERCILVGHSLGSLLALAAIKQAPERFSSAVFLSPTYGASGAWWLPIGFAAVAVFGLLSLILPFTEQGRGRLDYAKYAPTWDWSPRRILSDIRLTSARVYVFCMRQIYSRDTRDWWFGIKIPVLLIHGKRDTVIPIRNAKELLTLMPSAKLVVLENGNHILVVNNVEEVAAEIDQFARAS
ncbi:alpha/beta hydrolase [Candidatus Kaiserbacteria bacterium]|nr:alpha/beta hydrolase [Candidatus Kaiserbacteria bacterium]